MASSSRSLFLASVATRKEGHLAELISLDIGRFNRKHPSTIFAGYDIENKFANKKAQALLKAEFPENFFERFTSHALELMVKDIFGADQGTETKQQRLKIFFWLTICDSFYLFQKLQRRRPIL